MEKNNKLIVIVFLIIIGGVFLWFPFKHFMILKGWQSLNIDGNWQSQRVIKGNILDKIVIGIENTKISLENRINNYFPLYKGANSLYYDVNIRLNKLIYKKMVPIAKNTDGEYILKDKEAYYLNSSLEDKEAIKRVEELATLYNNIKKNTQAELYIYLPHRYEFQKNIKSNFGYRNMYEYVDLFKSKLDEKIKVSELLVNTKEEYNEFFYKSDHHWSAKGAYIGYEQIMDLLNIKNYSKSDNYIKINNSYLGSIANRIKNSTIKDDFDSINVNLDNYTVLVNDKEEKKYKPKQIDQDKVNANEYYDYYVNYYNGLYGRVVYNFNSEEKENLLIIADSYSWVIDDLIASNFNETHIINLMFDEYQTGIFYYQKYIEDNKIDKVLILQETVTTIFDAFDHGLLGKLV